MGFQLNVSSNVSDAYGANVYGFAVQDDDLLIEDVKSFFESYKESWTHIGPHVPAHVNNNTIPVSGTMTNVFNTIDPTTVGTIPHAFVDYTVYVAAENDLGLVSVESAGRHNGYSIVYMEDLHLNQVIAFTDNDPDNTLTANISSDFATSGNLMHYTVVGFSDPNITEEEAHWYADQRLLDGVALFGTTTVPFVNIQNQVTKVVGVIDHVNAASSAIYNIDDVNAGKVFVILKDVGSSGGSELDGIGSNHYGVQTSVLVINSTNSAQKAHASVKQVRTSANVVDVDVRGFSAFSVPTQFVAVAVPHGTSVDSEFGVTTLTETVAAGEVLRVFDHTFTFIGMDLSKEYDVYARFVTSDATKTSANSVMYSNLEDPTLTFLSKSLTTSTDPSATFTGLSVDASNVSGTVNLSAHPLIGGTATKVQVVLSVHGDKTVTDLVTFIVSAGAELLYHETTTIDATGESFNLSTTLEGYAVAQVSRVYVYALVTTRDESYLFRRLAEFPGIVSRNDTDDLFVSFGDVSMEYSNLDANIDAIFNKGTNALTEAFVVLTTHGYLTADPIGLDPVNPGVTLITTDLVAGNPLEPNELRILVAPTQTFTGAYNAAALTHEITVSMTSGQYAFSLSVSEFLKGHTYIFDNRLQKDSHPLNFDYQDGLSPYDFTPDADGYTTVAIPADATYTALFAHCANHLGMGDAVNNGATGIPVNVPSSVETSFELVSGQVYYVNVVTSAHSVYHGPLFQPNAAGIRAITAGFEAGSSGNVELTGINLNVLDPANETLKLVAYTYSLPNKNTAYTAAVSAVVSTSLSTLAAGLVSLTGTTVNLDKVIDIAGDVHDAFSTRNVYVYGWIENTGNKTSVFVTNALTPADQLYPHVTLVEYQDTNKLVVPAGRLSVVESGGSKVDKLYLLAFDSAVTTLGAPSFNYSPFLTVDKITEDLDQNSDDIYTNATSLNILFKYTSATDASVTDSVRPGQTVNVVLVAVTTDTGLKAFVKEFTVPSDVTGIHGAFGPMFSADKKSLMFMSGQARGPGQVRIGVFTSPQTDPMTAAGANYYDSTDAPSDGLSYLSALLSSVEVTHTTTTTPVLLEHVNRVYVYAWVHNEGIGSAVASAVAKHSSTNFFYTRIRDVNYTPSALTIDTSVFAFAKDITEYHVGVIESSYAETLTDDDIITTLTATYSPDKDLSPVKAYTTLLAQNTANIKATTLRYAIGSSGNVALLENHQYNVYLLAKKSEGGDTTDEELIGPVSYAINLPGVTEISNLAFDRANNQVTFDVTASGLDNTDNTGPGTLKAIAFTYANPTLSTGVNALVGTAQTVNSGVTGVTVTGLMIDKVMAKDGTQQDPNVINEVHVYVWLERGIEQSLVYSGSVWATATPYPVIHNAVQLENGSGFSGSLTVFDDADGYYIGLFPSVEIATAHPAELFYGFFVDNNVHFTQFPVTDGNVGNVDFTMTTAYTDLSNPGITPAIVSGTEYKMVAIALLNGGSFTMTQSASLVAIGKEIPLVKNFGIIYNATDDTADVQTIDLVVPNGGTGTFYALATTYPITNAANAHKLNNAARVTIASGVTSSVTGFSLANAFPKVMDLSGDVVDFKSVRAAYAYAWGVNPTTGGAGQVTFALNGFDGPNTDPIPRLNVVMADHVESTLTVESASVFSATHDVDKYMIFAMKDLNQTSAGVLTFVNTHLQYFTDFTGTGAGSFKTPFGEHNDFDPYLLEDDLYNVPMYSVVITQAFTQTANAEANERVEFGKSYRVYMAAKDSIGTTNLYEYPILLNLNATLDRSIARVGGLHSVTLDTSVQNYQTVSFGLDSVTASDAENAEIYAAVFTRDLKNEKHTRSLGDFKNEVYSTESSLTPILLVPAGTTVTTLSGFMVNKAFDTIGDLVDLYTVNTGYLYVWVRTLASVDFAGGRSAIRGENDVFAPPS